MTKNKLFQLFGLLIVAAVIISLPACKKTVLGCMDSVACNYSDTVTEDNGSCTYPEENYDCSGGCVNDQDGDGVCDENEVPGCMDATAFNYNEEATDGDGSCQYAASIMANTWNVSSQCTGMIIGNILPAEITIIEGASEGDLILDLGAGVTINGTIESDGSITIPAQDVGFDMITLSVSGNGQLDSETSASINVNFSSIFINDDCVLTLTM
ncbi:MAG: hypothetical protein CMP75_00495 [Flavobacteriales bacterium]|nr:hypothetical protein [Flavobacteriales bacterium]|tara:strand:+ start:1581 stop:2216 length:636 start_codon:yes stop_codon:yes gene_type:complete